MDRFAKAVTKIIKRFVDQGKESVDLYEVWIESSIPLDLIKEVIEIGEVQLPEGLKELRMKGNVIWRRGMN